MKIAFFTETFLPKVDGIVTRLTKTVKHLIEAGDEVVVFCPEGCPKTYMGAKVVGVPAMPLPLYPELKLGLPGPSVSDALENLQPNLKPDTATLKLLRRDPVETMFLELTSHPETGKQYESLYQKKLKTTEHGIISIIDSEYLANYEYFSNQKSE